MCNRMKQKGIQIDFVVKKVFAESVCKRGRGRGEPEVSFFFPHVLNLY